MTFTRMFEALSPADRAALEDWIVAELVDAYRGVTVEALHLLQRELADDPLQQQAIAAALSERALRP